MVSSCSVSTTSSDLGYLKSLSYVWHFSSISLILQPPIGGRLWVDYAFRKAFVNRFIIILRMGGQELPVMPAHERNIS